MKSAYISFFAEFRTSIVMSSEPSPMALVFSRQLPPISTLERYLPSLHDEHESSDPSKQVLHEGSHAVQIAPMI